MAYYIYITPATAIVQRGVKKCRNAHIHGDILLKKQNKNKEVEQLATWCSNHYLALNTMKTKEIIEDFRKTGQLSHSPLFIGNEEVERVSDFKFLVLTAAGDLLWGKNITSAIGRPQQRLSI